MRPFRILAALPFACMLAACAVYPLPEDVTGADSEDVARIVRCQTRDAIRDEVIANVLAARSPIVYEGETGNALAARLRTDPQAFRDLKWSRFVKELSDPFLFYKDVAISYDFTIDTMEVNTAGFDLTLLRQFTRGTEKIGAVARNDRTREIKRHFRVFDTFDSLARLLPERVCQIDPQRADLLYPSIGRIKINTLVAKFLRQNENGNLGGDKDDYLTPMMTDTITFTTKFTGNLDPSAQLNPLANNFVPSNVALSVDNSRQDLHTIIILLQLPASRKNIPQFDPLGRLMAKGNARREVAARALDQQRAFNTQDALIAIGTGLTRLQ